MPNYMVTYRNQDKKPNDNKLFGKTRLGLMAVSRFQKKNPDKLIIIAVPSDPIKVQWLKELESLGLKADVRTYYDTSKHEYEASLVILDK